MSEEQPPVSEAEEPLEFAGLSRQELIELIQLQGEGPIRIQFVGKSTARRLARRVRPRVTEPIKKLGIGSPEEQAQCQLVEGDNLQAMATLYRTRGHVDLIITDPPYNTGNDFRYNDRWDEDPNDPGIGDLVPETDGARHTKWMKFMWPRLQMMRAMLRESGVLAVCIDHRELFRLGQMLDELFGEANRLAIINWQKITSPKNHETGVSTATEYVLVYAKNADRSRTGLVDRSDAAASSYRNPDRDPEGAWTSSDSTLLGAATHSGQVYAIQNPFTGRLHYPQEGRCWRNERAKMKAAVEEWGVSYVDVDLGDGCDPALLIKGASFPVPADPFSDRAVAAARKKAMQRRDRGAWPRFYWRDDRARRAGEGELRYKTYLEKVKAGVVPTTFWAAEDFDTLDLGPMSWQHPESGTSEIGVKELSAVVGRGHGFTTVKPLQLFTKIISLWCPANGLVLDPFAGSGTTGHAVWSLNAEAGTTRRFILIEQGRPERGDSFARTLAAERLRRVATGDWASGVRDPLPGGCAFVTLKKRVDAEALLRMERDEMAETVIFSYFDARRRGRPGLVRIEEDHRYLVARNEDGEGFFLVWDGPDKNTSLTREVYGEIAAEAKAAGVKRPYHVYARQQLYVTNTIRFYQIPDRILADFGLNPMSEPFTEVDE